MRLASCFHVKVFFCLTAGCLGLLIATITWICWRITTNSSSTLPGWPSHLHLSTSSFPLYSLLFPLLFFFFLLCPFFSLSLPFLLSSLFRPLLFPPLLLFLDLSLHRLPVISSQTADSVVTKHPDTNEEIKLLCQDLKVLGKKDFR